MTNPTGIEAEVCRDIADRQARGVAKYGVTLQDNPARLSEWIQHAYEESIDLPNYLKKAKKKAEELEAKWDELSDWLASEIATLKRRMAKNESADQNLQALSQASRLNMAVKVRDWIEINVQGAKPCV